MKHGQAKRKSSFDIAEGQESPDLHREWSKADLVFLVESSPDLILVVDADYSILTLNRTVEKLLGFKKSELIGKPLHALFETEAPDWRAPQGLGAVTGPFRLRRKDGSICLMDLTVCPAPWQGAPALTFTLRDVTERQRMEEERERLIEDLQEALSRVKRLSGLLPMCASCKRIRDFQGYWEAVEQYISEHSEAEFTHSICPECREKLYPELNGGEKYKKRLVIED